VSIQAFSLASFAISHFSPLLHFLILFLLSFPHFFRLSGICLSPFLILFLLQIDFFRLSFYASFAFKSPVKKNCCLLFRVSRIKYINMSQLECSSFLSQLVLQLANKKPTCKQEKIFLFPLYPFLNRQQNHKLKVKVKHFHANGFV